MIRNHQPGQSVFRSILPEEIEWKPFPAFPPAARLAVMVGHPSERSQLEPVEQAARPRLRRDCHKRRQVSGAVDVEPDARQLDDAWL